MYINLFGWYGTFAIVGAYALVSFGILSSTAILYQVLNLTGSVGILLSSITKKDYQPAVLNIVWTIIAGIAIVRIIFIH